MRYEIHLMIAVSLFFAQAAGAGHIDFWEKKSQGGKREGTLPDHRRNNIDLKKWGGWDNDEISSLTLRWVTPGTHIQLFDSPDGRRNGDWTEIVVKRWAKEIEPRGLESNARSRDYDQVYYAQDGSLNGKVSHIKVIPAVPVDPPFEARLNLCLQRLDGYKFLKERGRAEEVTAQGSRYRTRFPDFVVKPDGTFSATLKVNHIRNNAKDDYAIIRMEFDGDRVLTGNDVETVIDEKRFRATADEIWSSVKDSKAATSNKYVIIARAATATAATVYDFAQDISDGGGRKYFPTFIERVMNDYGKAIADCDERRFAARAPKDPGPGADDVNPGGGDANPKTVVPQASTGKYQYHVSFKERFKNERLQKIVKGKTLVCTSSPSRTECRWGSNDKTPSVAGCRKYKRAFNNRTVTGYGYRGRMLSKAELGRCNANKTF